MALIEMTPPTNTIPLAVRIGTRLRAIRKAQDLRLTDVAQAMGTSPQTAQRLEKANMTMSLEWVERYCAALGIAPEELFVTDTAAESFHDQRRKLLAKARLLHAAGTNFLIDLETLLGQGDG